MASGTSTSGDSVSNKATRLTTVRADKPRTDLAEKRRILQLETLFDLALALHADRPEEELVEELLMRVCAVLDPAPRSRSPATLRRAAGDAAAWAGRRPPPRRRACCRTPVARPAGRRSAGGAHAAVDSPAAITDELIATPLAYRGVFLGYLALLDKESRVEATATLQRFTVGGPAFPRLGGGAGRRLSRLARQLEDLTTQRERLRRGEQGPQGPAGGRAHGPAHRRPRAGYAPGARDGRAGGAAQRQRPAAR